MFTKEEKSVINAYVTSKNSDIIMIKNKILKTCSNNADKRLILLDGLSRLGLVEEFNERTSLMLDAIIDSWEDRYYESIRRRNFSTMRSEESEKDIAEAIKRFGGIGKILKSFK